MNLTRDRVHSIGWMSVLLVCAAISLALMLRVNAVKSRVAASQKHIVYLEHDIDFLQTEFQTRSNQQQLKTLNDVEFGYAAPKAEQYIEGERQLAALGQQAAPGAPAPIRYASAEVPAQDVAESSNPILAMVSPVSGTAPGKARAVSDSGEAVSDKTEAKALAHDARELGKRLARIELAGDDR